MALFTESEARARAQRAAAQDKTIRKSYSSRSSRELLSEANASYSAAITYDVFLSHSVRDADVVLGIKGLLEDFGYSVYVDWIDDPQLDRSKVSAKTADTLRSRMKNSKSLLYLTTDNASDSKWMPWECGYFDGLKGKVAIVPVKTYKTDAYSGQEYLGLYPYCTKGMNRAGNEKLWVYKDSKTSLVFPIWLETNPSELIWNSDDN